ncbi:tetratricopeptide repeat protein [Candidatus Desantisbacteria bacterium]|nr:tetratricopeptide repeat protein [Candidatus Desantisbacteria bacterium]
MKPVRNKIIDLNTKSIFFIFFVNFLLYGCAAVRLPSLPVSYEPPKLEITQKEIKKRQIEEEKQKQKDITLKAIETVKLLLNESSTPLNIKYSNNRLKEGKNWLVEAESLLNKENFIESQKASERARMEINTAIGESKAKEEEDRKKKAEEVKRKEAEEAKRKEEEARKIREKTAALSLVESARLKREKTFNPEVKKYLTEKVNKINLLITKAESFIAAEDYKSVKDSVTEANTLLDSIIPELSNILAKINGEEIFTDINKLVEVKNFGEAYFKLRKYVRDFPDSKYIPESYFYIGVCYESFDNYDRAKETFEFVINNYSNTEWAAQSKDHIDINLKERFLKKAKEAKSSASSSNGQKEKQAEKERPAADEGTAEKTGQDTATKSIVESPLKKEEITNRYNEAIALLLKKKQVNEAREKLEHLLSAPDNFLLDNILYWIGETYYSQNDFDKAIEYFDKVLNNEIKGNKDVDSQFKIGLSFYNLKKYEEALKVFKVISVKYPAHKINKEVLKYIGIVENKIKSTSR